MIQEKEARSLPGLLMLLVGFGAGVFGVVTLVGLDEEFSVPRLVTGIVLCLGAFLHLFGHQIVAPNDSSVMLLFGRYVGTLREAGWHWVNPFTSRRRVSLRVRNFETDRLKVNDLDGNPVEIAAVIVWRVVDTAEASFEVDDYAHYVHVQSESALRNMATHYPYDNDNDEEISLRGSTDAVADKLQQEVGRAVGQGGRRRA